MKKNKRTGNAPEMNNSRSSLNVQRSTLNAQRPPLNTQRSTLNAQPLAPHGHGFPHYILQKGYRMSL